MLTGYIRDMLIRHFAVSTNIEDPDLRQYIWRDNDTTGILVESIYRWVGTLTEKRPALLIKRNAYKNSRLGIADIVRTTEDGHLDFTTAWVGSHTVFCVHGKGAAAEVLATEVARELHHFHWAIARTLDLLRWVVTDVGAIAKVEEARESFVVPVTVGWAYREAWRLEFESMKLRRIALHLELPL